MNKGGNYLLPPPPPPPQSYGLHFVFVAESETDGLAKPYLLGCPFHGVGLIYRLYYPSVLLATLEVNHMQAFYSPTCRGADFRWARSPARRFSTVRPFKHAVGTILACKKKPGLARAGSVGARASLYRLRLKVILCNEYDESEWPSVMTNQENMLLN